MNHVDLKPCSASIISITSLSGLFSSMYKRLMLGLYTVHGSWGTLVGAVQLRSWWVTGSGASSTAWSTTVVPVGAASDAITA